MEQPHAAKRFQFSLRTLFGLVTAVCVIAAWGSEGFAICWLAAMVLAVIWVVRHFKDWQQAAIALLLIIPTGFMVFAAISLYFWPEELPRVIAARRSQCRSQLDLIQRVIDENQYRKGQPLEAYSANAEGKPLLSWQVGLLQSIGERKLDAAFELDEPWDSRNNKRLVGETPFVFSCPIDKLAREKGYTSYVAVAEPGSNGDKPPLIKAVIEVHNSKVPWTKPFYLTPAEAARRLKSIDHHGGVHVLFVKTGEVRYYEDGEKLPFGPEQ